MLREELFERLTNIHLQNGSLYASGTKFRKHFRIESVFVFIHIPRNRHRVCECLQIRGFSVIEYLIEELGKPTDLHVLVTLDSLNITFCDRLCVHIFSVANNFVVVFNEVAKIAHNLFESDDFFRCESSLACKFTKETLDFGIIPFSEISLCVPFKQALIIGYTGLFLQDGDEVNLLIG